MDALEFARELKRMCDSCEDCYACVLNTVSGKPLCTKERLNEAVPLVEQWSKERPKVTNLDHHAEELEKLGYKVDKNTLRDTCPVHKSMLFIEDICDKGLSVCPSCLKWWDEEYKETDKS